MFDRMEAYEYLWPPRPERAVPKDMLDYYERQGWVAQIKKNGTCSVIAVSPDREIIAMNRHKESHKLWSPTAASSAAFQNLPGDGWFVFVAELLHSKVSGGPRDTNYVFDVLVDNGDYLVGETFQDRQARLAELFPDSVGETQSHRMIDNNTWVAKLLTENFSGVFAGLTAAEDEGIVLKNPKAKLTMCFRQSANADWQVKCRRLSKNYGF